MKYSKIIAITAISIMIFSGMSAVVSAGFFTRSEVTKEISDEGTIKLIEYGLFTREIYVIEVDGPVDINGNIKGYFPVNLEEFKGFKEDGLKVKFTGVLDFPSIITRDGLPVFVRGYLPIKLTTIEKIIQEPKLEFDISIEKQFMTEEVIPVKATLENVGNMPVIVDEMNPVVSTLDLEIHTPDQKTLFYTGERERRMPEKIELMPGQKIQYNFEDITEPGLFGNNLLESYRFITGDYTIKGLYYTKVRTILPDGEDGSDEDKKIRTYETKNNRFEINDEIPETAELTLATSPREISNEVFSYSPQPKDIIALLDGRIHLEYDLGTEVSISVEEVYEDYVFDKFSVDITSSESEATFVMDSDKLVIANYKLDQPEPIPPIACFTFSPEEIFVGSEVLFDASCSSDEDGEIVSYKWDFGDGLCKEEINAVHVFDYVGVYEVGLIVRDDDGLSGRFSCHIRVIEQEPTDSGMIYGTIKEKSEIVVEEKIPIANAKIEVFETGRTKGNCYTATSDRNGNYEIEDVKIGEYKVVVSKEGYKPETDVVLVEANTENELNFALEKRGAELEFDIKVEPQIISAERPLVITASLKNNGDSSLIVSDIGIYYRTLKLQIRTPDGKILITKPGTIVFIPPTVEIIPGEYYSVLIDDLTADDFIELSTDSQEPYEFEPSEEPYILKGIYHSWGPRDGRWHGKLISNEETFVFQ